MFYFFLWVGEIFIFLDGEPFTNKTGLFEGICLLKRSSYLDELKRSFFLGLGPFVKLGGLY